MKPVILPYDIDSDTRQQVPTVQKQTTISNNVSYTGIALHSGEEVKMDLRPGAPGTGVIFRRVDIEGQDNEVAAVFDNVGETMLGTTIINEAGTRVATIEHFMAACSSLGVDNGKSVV